TTYATLANLDPLYFIVKTALKIFPILKSAPSFLKIGYRFISFAILFLAALQTVIVLVGFGLAIVIAVFTVSQILWLIPEIYLKFKGETKLPQHVNNCLKYFDYLCLLIECILPIQGTFTLILYYGMIIISV